MNTSTKPANVSVNTTKSNKSSSVAPQPKYGCDVNLIMFNTLSNPDILKQPDWEDVYFAPALKENRIMAMKIFFYIGENNQELFMRIFKWLEKNNNLMLNWSMTVLPKYFGYRVLTSFTKTGLRLKAMKKIKDYLEDPETRDEMLVALPRRGNSLDSATFVKGLYTYLGYENHEAYRKDIVSKTPINLQSLMCNERWSEIEYDKLSRDELFINHKSFLKHDTERYTEFLNNRQESFRENISKVINSLMEGDDSHVEYRKLPTQILTKEALTYSKDTINYPNYSLLVQTKWNNSLTNSMLPLNTKKEPKFNVLPVINTARIIDKTCDFDNTYRHIINSMAMYVSTQNTGIMKDLYLTFDETLGMQSLPSTSKDVITAYDSIPIEHVRLTSFNLGATYQTLLDFALKSKLSPKKIPKSLLVMTYGKDSLNQLTEVETIHDMVRLKGEYERNGYALPKLIIWDMESETIPNHMSIIEEHPTITLLKGFHKHAPYYILEHLDNLESKGWMLKQLPYRDLQEKMIEKDKERREKARKKRARVAQKKHNNYYNKK